MPTVGAGATLVLPAGPRHWEQWVRHNTSTVTWWGHATVEIRLDGTRLVTDPLLRNRVGPLHSLGHRPSRRDVDALTSVDGVLLSHLHHDHTDLPSIRRFGPTTTTVVPRVHTPKMDATASDASRSSADPPVTTSASRKTTLHTTDAIPT